MQNVASAVLEQPCYYMLLLYDVHTNVRIRKANTATSKQHG